MVNMWDVLEEILEIHVKIYYYNLISNANNNKIKIVQYNMKNVYNFFKKKLRWSEYPKKLTPLLSFDPNIDFSRHCGDSLGAFEL